MNIFTTIGEWWKKATAVTPPEQQLKAALNNLLRDDPNSAARWKYINCYMPALGFSIRVGDLPGTSEAQTIVRETSIEIVVDIEKVKRLRDCLEAVIGHELKHADDAFTMGLTNYMNKVQSEGDKDWWHKDVELGAIGFEDELRGRLIKTGKYNSIARTRAEQNRRAHL